MRFILLFVLALLLTGCPGESSDSPGEESATGAETQEGNATGSDTADSSPRLMARAGEDIQVAEGETFSVHGQSSPEQGAFVRRILWYQTPSDYRLVLEEGQQPDQNRVSYRAPLIDRAQRDLILVLEVESSSGRLVRDTLTVTVTSDDPRPLPSVAVDGPAEVTGGEPVSLTGQARSERGLLSFHWRQTSGPEVESVQGQEQAQLQFRAPQVPGSRALGLELAVTDQDGRIGYGRRTVRVIPARDNRPPTVDDAFADPGVATSGETFRLMASASDPDGDSLAYQWQQHGEPPFALALRESDSEQASGLLPEIEEPVTLQFRVTASDGAESDSRIVTLDAVPREAPDPGILACMMDLGAPGCPLQVLGELLGEEGVMRCDDPLSQECPYRILARLSPDLAECLREPSGEGCGTLLRKLADPLFVMGYLPGAVRTLECNPAYDERTFSHYQGVMHGHTGYSDGTIGTRPLDAMERVRNQGQEFFGISDHSDNTALPMTLTGDCLSEQLFDCLIADKEQPSDSLRKWQATSEQIEAVNTGDFTGFRGFEWTSDRFGHINVFFSRYFINAKTGPGYGVSMGRFWQWLAYPANFGGGSDGLIVFNHPGREDLLEDLVAPLGEGDPAYAFNQFEFIPSADYRAVGLEVFGKSSEYDSDGPGGSWLSFALDQGWHMGVVGSEDHHGTSWGSASLPKTITIGRSLEAMDIKEALLSRRMYAVAQFYNDLRLEYFVDGEPMGSRIRRPEGSKLPLEVVVTRNGEPFEAIVEVVSRGNETVLTGTGSQVSGQLPVSDETRYYFLRISDPETGRPVAFASPVWLLPGEEPLPACDYEALETGLFPFDFAAGEMPASL